MRLRWIFLLSFAVLVSLGAALLVGGRFLMTPVYAEPKPVMVLISPGSGLAEILDTLMTHGVVNRKQATLFKYWVILRGKQSKLQAGEYWIEPGLLPSQLLQKLVQGAVYHHRFTLIEGWNFRQTWAELQRAPYLIRDLAGFEEGLLAGPPFGKLRSVSLITFLELPIVALEGQFYPDTYLYTRGTRQSDLLKRAYRSMQAKLDETWAHRDPTITLKSPHEALVLASMIEKEGHRTSELPEISGVFHARLSKNMRLQSDPTVIYGLGSNFSGDLKRRHLRRSTDYNTYVHKGLPPTPICMPGYDSLHAAMHPKLGSFYFVAKGDGSHQFSKTLVAHQRAVSKYQLKKPAVVVH